MGHGRRDKETWFELREISETQSRYRGGGVETDAS